MSSSTTFPVQVLREHLTELEAAISVCLAEPAPKPVHKLRTETRRVEALLLLLAHVPGLPEHRREVAAFLRAIAKLRRAAGTLRDLDVHRKMLESLTANAKIAGEGESSAHSARESAAGSEDLQKSARKLRQEMGAKRDKAAGELQSLLKRRQIRTARSAEKLMEVLESAKDVQLEARKVLQDADSVLARDGLLKPGAIAAITKKDLHTVRKAAKAARYVAESVVNDPALFQAARAFESLQEAGGQWHDAMELAKAARRSFGKNHPLTSFYRHQRDSKLEAYRDALKARVTVHRQAFKRKPTTNATTKRATAA